jgi:aminoacylase
MFSRQLSANQKADLDSQAINNFRAYLQIPSVHPNVNYDACIKFLENQAKSLNLPITIVSPVPQKPIVILTWVGTEPTLPTILLNSHMDVVPVFEEKWTHKPFSADIDEQNNIYARGSQDMKCVGIQYLEAVRRLKKRGITLKRTLHLSFVPDEEIGGFDGMKRFVRTKDFQDLNVGAALDEGMASPTDEFALFYGERCVWHLKIHCSGTPGHGSLLLHNTAGEKASHILNKLFDFRNQEKQKLVDNPSWTLGDVTTVNLTQISGGVQANVVPPELLITFDCRIPPEHVNIATWEKTVNQWCKEAGVWVEYPVKQPQILPTKLDNSNIYWVAFKKSTDKLGLKLKPQIFPGATDSRNIREIGIPVIGFSPINNTPILLHDHDEYLGVETFLKGIEIYCGILISVGNVEERSG